MAGSSQRFSKQKANMRKKMGEDKDMRKRRKKSKVTMPIIKISKAAEKKPTKAKKKKVSMNPKRGMTKKSYTGTYTKATGKKKQAAIKSRKEANKKRSKQKLGGYR